MFEFNKLCNEYEKLGSIERDVLIVEKSVSVINGLKELDCPVDPFETLVAFIIGSVAVDGAISEKDYLYIYPSLVKAFGKDFDYGAIKRAYKVAGDIKKEIDRRTQDLMSIIAAIDEDLRADVISLCLLVTSVDGKISFKEKRYIKRLCKK